MENIQAQQLNSGDLIVVLENEQIPCDAVCLVSSDPTGAVMMSTKSLDGETNLKTRRCPQITHGVFDPEADAAALRVDTQDDLSMAIENRRSHVEDFF